MDGRVKGFAIVSILVAVAVIGGWAYEQTAWHPSDSSDPTIRYGSFDYDGTIRYDGRTTHIDTTITTSSGRITIKINDNEYSQDIPTNKNVWALVRSGDVWYDGNGRSHETTEVTDGKGSYYTVSENGYIVSINGDMSGIRVNLTLEGWHH